MSLGSVNLIHFNTQTTVTLDDQPRVVGGVTSGVLRYPHLIQELISIKEQEKDKLGTHVLIFGPGLAKVDRVSSPHLHEVLAAFPSKSEVTVVDNDEELISEIGKSTFGAIERNLAESVLTSYDGYSVSKFDPAAVHAIKKYVQEIPENVTQNLEVHQSDFENFKLPKKYDYIFALQSLVYQLLNYQSLNQKENRANSRLFIAKYLGGLKENGTLIIDEIAYQLMKDHFNVLPSAEDLEKGAVKWNYGAKNSNTPFETRKVVIPNQSRLDNSKANRLPSIYYMDQNGQSRDVTTTDIYLITRLPAK